MADTLQQLLNERADRDTVAVRYEGRTWTYGQYVAGAKTQAAALIGAANRSRPLHVGVLMGNTPDMLTALAATALGGYVVCGINTTRRGEALARDILKVDCQFLVTDAEHRPLLDGLELPGVTVLDTSSAGWADFLAGAPAFVPHREVAVDDTFMMIFTSGTSGDPKAVQVAHMMPLFAGNALVERFELTDRDTCYLSMPMFHSNAVVGGWAPALVAGTAMVPASFPRPASGRYPPLRRHVHELRRQAAGLRAGHARAT